MRTRTALLLVFVALLGSILVGVSAATSRLLRRAETRRLVTSLDRASVVAGEYVRAQDALLASEVRVVAQEPRLRAVMASEDATSEAVGSVAQRLQSALRAELLVLTDPDGAVTTAIGEEPASHDEWVRVVRRALSVGEASGALVTRRRVVGLRAARVDIGGSPAGCLLVGRSIGRGLVEAVRRQTGLAAIVRHGTDVLEAQPSHPFSRLSSAERERVAEALGPDGAAELALRHVSYLARSRSLPGLSDRSQLVLFGSLDAALAPADELLQTLVLIFAACLALATILAHVLAGRLTRPLEALVALAHEVGRGRWDVRAAPSGPTEMRALSGAMTQMAGQLEGARQTVLEKDRLERDLAIAARIQSALLPGRVVVPGLDVAACTLPAASVGGDYYDVLPTGDGCYIGLGDVAGHGLPAGLIMLMVQTGISTLIEADRGASPARILCALNSVLYANVHHRLGQREYVTMVLLRYHPDGRVVYAGAHEEIVVVPTEGPARRLPTDGAWLAESADIAAETRDSELTLAVGDLLILYSDGIPEAVDADGRPFGTRRLVTIAERHRADPVNQIRDRILEAFEAWTTERRDDVTILVARRVPAP